ncbi:MAG: hypothetical protein ACRBCT_03100 [Alphaproteobacteria bacterium]
MHSFKIRFSLSLVLSTILALFLTSAAQAQFAASPCDPEYYESMEARAILEAQREITQNQNLIVKPDSVLEYTCFDRQLDVLAQEAENMFSESDRWETILATDHMDKALEALVGGAMKSYLDANFDHTFLGGRTSLSYPYDGTVEGNAYTCASMQSVWIQAKCMNFIQRSHDGFFTLDEYANGSDKRELPTACAAFASWQSNIDTATESTPWDSDDVATYLDRVFPTSGCGGNTSRIKTGMLVEDKGNTDTPDEYNEFACIVPGCFWEPTGLNAGSCTR